MKSNILNITLKENHIRKNELFNIGSPQFTYVHYEYDLIPMCISATFSPAKLKKLINTKCQLSWVLINIVSHKTNNYMLLLVIVIYTKQIELRSIQSHELD